MSLRQLVAIALALVLSCGLMIYALTSLFERAADRHDMPARCHDVVIRMFGGGTATCDHPDQRIKPLSGDTFLCKCPDSAAPQGNP